MSMPIRGWKNKGGTGGRACAPCGTWKAHWTKRSGRTWPGDCSVENCSAAAALGAHIYHATVSGERIVPMCDGCNQLEDPFDLKAGTWSVSATACT
jgi:hypothetical protein